MTHANMARYQSPHLDHSNQTAVMGSGRKRSRRDSSGVLAHSGSTPASESKRVKKTHRRHGKSAPADNTGDEVIPNPGPISSPVSPKSAPKTKRLPVSEDTDSADDAVTKHAKSSETGDTTDDDVDVESAAAATSDDQSASVASAEDVEVPDKTSKYLKSVTRLLNKIEARLSVHPPPEDTAGTTDELLAQFAIIHTNLVQTRENVAALDLNRQRDKIRKNARHCILFNALRKISRDVTGIKEALATGSKTIPPVTDTSGGVPATPAAADTATAQGTNPEGTTEDVAGGTEVLTVRKKRAYKKRASAAGGSADAAAAVPAVPEKKPPGAHAEGKKTMEQVLKGYTDDLENMTDLEELKEKADLCVRYADAIFRTYV